MSTSLMAANPFSIPVALDGVVNLQGRGESGPAWSVELTVEFYPEGSTIAENTISVQTNESGVFSIADTGLDPGNYVITIKNAHSLKIAYAASLAEGSNSYDFGSLPEADANDDNAVTILDFSILSSSFSLASSDPGFDGRADFNEDGAITIQDFSLLSTNFGQTGYIVTENSYSELLASQGGRISGEKSYSTALYGEFVNLPLNEISMTEAVLEWRTEFTENNKVNVRLILKSGAQKIDGAELYLRYEGLNLLSTQTANKLPLKLAHINGEGAAHYAMGTLDELPNGTMELLNMEFAISDMDKVPVINLDKVKSAITYAGRNILGKVNESLTISGEAVIYPNPGEGIFNVYQSVSESVSYQVSDLRGNIVMEKEWQGPLVLDLSHLPTGVYLLHMTSGDKTKIQRIVKQ